MEKEITEKKNDEPKENLPKELETILQGIPEKKQKEVRRVVKRILVHQSSFSGPIPPPEVLSGYNTIVPNGAERIAAMAEKQAAHRINIEDFAVKEGFKQSGRGQIYGFILGLVALLVAVWLGSQGHDWLGGVIATTTIGAFLTAFVLDKKQSKKE